MLQLKMHAGKSKMTNSTGERCQSVLYGRVEYVVRVAVISLERTK